MSLHINPLFATQSNEGIVLAPEIMVIYTEDSAEFDYIRGLIGDWEYYVSRVVALPNAAAKTMLEANGAMAEKTGGCAAYIYGWMPGSVEYVEGMCVAIVFFDTPTLSLAETPLDCSVSVQISDEATIAFSGGKTVPVTFPVCEPAANE